MAKLTELRRWARGEPVEGLPNRAGAPRITKEPDLVKGNPNLETHKYKISTDGTDALLKFGRHYGRTVSYLAAKHRSYLRWILRKAEFDQALKDVVAHQLGDTK